MAYDTLLFQVHDGVATVTLNRPDKRNALNDRAIAQLGDAVERLAGDPSLRGAIVTGPEARRSRPAPTSPSSPGRDRSTPAPARRGQAALRRLETCGKPIVAAVNGVAPGGGCELAMACHLRVAREEARFGQPEVKLGLTPGFGGTQRLPRLVGLGVALELLLTGEPINA